MPMIGLPPRSSSRRDAVVHVALEIERGHRRIGGFVEPAAGPQALVFAAVVTGHWRVPPVSAIGPDTVRPGAAGQASPCKGWGVLTGLRNRECDRP